jgi:hypothetical protein
LIKKLSGQYPRLDVGITYLVRQPFPGEAGVKNATLYFTNPRGRVEAAHLTPLPSLGNYSGFILRGIAPGDSFEGQRLVVARAVRSEDGDGWVPGTESERQLGPWIGRAESLLDYARAVR